MRRARCGGLLVARSGVMRRGAKGAGHRRWSVATGTEGSNSSDVGGGSLVRWHEPDGRESVSPVCERSGCKLPGRLACFKKCEIASYCTRDESDPSDRPVGKASNRHELLLTKAGVYLFKKVARAHAVLEMRESPSEPFCREASNRHELASVKAAVRKRPWSKA